MAEINVQDEQGTIHAFPDGSTPEMIAAAMRVKPPAPTQAVMSATAPGDVRTPPSGYSRGFAGPNDAQRDSGFFIDRMGTQAGRALSDASNFLPSGKSLLQMLTYPASLPWMAKDQYQQVKQMTGDQRPDPAKIAGDAVPGFLASLVTGAASKLPNPAEADFSNFPNPRAALRGSLYKEMPKSGTGPTLTKGATAVSKGLGAAGGAAAAHAVPIPGAGYAGGVAGFEAGPSILRKIIGTPEVGEVTNPGPYSPLPNRVPASVIRSEGLRSIAERDATRQNVPFAGEEPEPAPPQPKTTQDSPTFLPEPRAPFAGEQQGYMSSVPRDQLIDMAKSGKPGAGAQLQQLGKPVIYIPRGAGIESPRLPFLPQAESPALTPAVSDPLAPPRSMINAIPSPEYDPNIPTEGQRLEASTAEKARLAGDKAPIGRERRTRVRGADEQALNDAWKQARQEFGDSRENITPATTEQIESRVQEILNATPPFLRRFK